MRPLVVRVGGERAADGRYGRAPVAADAGCCALRTACLALLVRRVHGRRRPAWLLEAARDALLFQTVRDGRWLLGSKRYVRRVVLGESRVEPIAADQQAAAHGAQLYSSGARQPTAAEQQNAVKDARLFASGMLRPKAAWQQGATQGAWLSSCSS